VFHSDELEIIIIIIAIIIIMILLYGVPKENEGAGPL